MSDPSKYHKVDPKLLDDHTLYQLKDLQTCVKSRIEHMSEVMSFEYKLAEEIANELKEGGLLSIKVPLMAEVRIMHEFTVFIRGRQKPEDHPDVQAFIERTRKSVNDKLTKERLEAAGLTEASRTEVENQILSRLG